MAAHSNSYVRAIGEAAGGDIALRAGGDIVSTAESEIDPHGGDLAFGGYLDVVAGGLVDIGNPIENTGGDGGSMSFIAGDKVIVRNKLNTTGQGDAGSGGDIDIIAGTDVEIALAGQIQNRGTGSAVGSGGGDVGAVFVSAGLGDITVRGEINVQSGTPDGGGGDIEFFTLGSIYVEPGGSS